MTLQKLQIQTEKELKKVLSSARKEKKLAKKLPQVACAVEITLLNEADMIDLNYQYRKKKKPTDVLSFRTPKMFQKIGVLGSIMICAPILKKQAKEAGHSDVAELRVLLVHGFLHLLGFDHEKSAKAAREMQEMEKLLLKGMGLIQRTRVK